MPAPANRPPPAIAPPAAHPGRQALIAIVIAVILVMSAAFTAGPTPALGATSLSATCGANVRTRPSAGATVRVTIPAGTRVVANVIVTGGRWTSSCGKSATSTRWYRITSINGRTVKARYGVTYLYAAVGLFRTASPPAAATPSPSPASTTMAPACSGVNIRTGASTGTTIKAKLATGSTVTVVATVSGSSWSATCPTAKSGSTWYRISAVNGLSVSSLYGVTYLYAATSMLDAAPVGTPAPTPTPSPTPEASPTTTPEVTPPPTPEVTPSPTPEASPSVAPTPTWIEGIDVSHWQGTINWPMVAAAGKRFAFIKASEATGFVDTMYATNRSLAKAVGILVGAYHFARPDATPGDAIAEADHFVNTWSPAVGDLLPVLDLETAGGLTTTPLQTWVRDFMNRVYERTGIRGAIYVSPAFWSKYMGNTTAFALEGYEFLWVAHWTTLAQPTVPASNWAGKGWTFWQYTSDGSVPGISGRVDLNRYRYTDFTPVLVSAVVPVLVPPPG